MSKTIEVTFPSLYAKQYEAIFCPRRYALIESGTKTGKTVGCSIWMDSEVLAKDVEGDVSWWVAPTYSQAELGYTRMKALMPSELITCQDTKLQITFPNGAIVQCKSGEKPDNLFGAAVKRAVIDEASRLREEAWHALRTTLTQTRGPVRIIGNPKGRKNWFWRWCQLAKMDGDPEASYFHLRSVDNPHISEEEVEKARKELPPSVFQELYEGIAQEDGAGVFRNVRECLIPANAKAPVDGRPYVAGLDLARLKDFSVLFIMDGITREVVYFDRIHELNWNLQVLRFRTAIQRYNNAQVLMDVTGLGDPIYDQLCLAGVNVTPYSFNNESKGRLIEALSIAFERKLIRIPDDRQLIHELEVFEYVLSETGRVRYGAPEGLHDDMVIALALCNMMAERCGYRIPKPQSIEDTLTRRFGFDVRPCGVEYWAGRDLREIMKRTPTGRPQGVEV